MSNGQYSNPGFKHSIFHSEGKRANQYTTIASYCNGHYIAFQKCTKNSFKVSGSSTKKASFELSYSAFLIKFLVVDMGERKNMQRPINHNNLIDGRMYKSKSLLVQLFISKGK